MIMILTAVTTKLVSVPFNTPIRVSTFVIAKRTAIIVEIETDEGITGMGYLPILGQGGETIRTCMDRDIADLLIGENPLYRKKYSRYGFRKLIDRKAGDIGMINLRAGGITESVRIANMASANRLPVTPHLAWELQIQIFAAIPNGVYIEYMNWYDDLFEDVPLIKDGLVNVWDRPGHGLKFRDEILKKYAVL
ncbi:enolase C-terminal domain-like protein [Paenibacillus lignilyticus]|uniref:Enolase C-terminal domain-containing protein n=1 Tax=Paenibacillus lignilyticus TaxID=1172615 RepID=A0ABS5CAW5_9BACL|nr:enolase C-terminal domain-like protein [Paenibacillus lignilyticus]MBP3963137.1 hypothetical protein [Paenibacillus lignilyticus]